MQVKNIVERFKHPLGAFQAYSYLKKEADAKDLFLLESLSGPEVCLRKAMLGVNPVLTFTIKKGCITFSGNGILCEQMGLILAECVLLNKKSPDSFELQDHQRFFDVLRLIETSFKVDYQVGFDFDYRFGFLGYFGYDAISYIETVQQKIGDTLPLPDGVLRLYQAVLYVDLKSEASYWVSNQFEGLDNSQVEAFKKMLSAGPIKPEEEPILEHTILPPEKIQDSITKAAYCRSVDEALKHIALGDIYQIQLGHTITIESKIDPFIVYKRLREINPSPYMYFVEIDEMRIIGASPELCVHLHEEQIIIRPIAGTIRRGKSPEEEAALKSTLQNDPKEKAEHIMLVDLARNDISRVCRVNTLKVTELMVIEAYSHVFHLVSNVVGCLRAGLDHYDVIAASFPAGTLTGAPKIRAMELIEDMETTRRSIYGGCLGFIDFRGNTEMAICIRTALYQQGHYLIRASAGIVVDSIAKKEWQETYAKLSASYFAITGRELNDENFTD